MKVEKTKKFFIIILSFCFMLTYYPLEAFAARTPSVHLISIGISTDGVTVITSTPLTVGSPVTLKPVYNPTNTTNKTVSWSSSKTGVATVNSTTGLVTPKKAGTTTITVTSADQYYGRITAKCVVTVITKPVPVTAVSITTSSVNPIAVGSTATLKANIFPSNATNQNVTWTSDNPGVATVSSTGLTATIKAGTPGSANITVTTADGGFTATYLVTTAIVNVSNVDISPTSASLAVGSTATLKATISPSNATNQNVTWASNNTSVATVSSTGLVATVMAVAEGTATITVTTADGNIPKDCIVTVIKKPAAKLLFTFDDGYVDDLAAAKIMDTYGFKGTAYVIEEGPTWGPEYMTVPQIGSLYKDGWDIADHTQKHYDLPDWSLSTILNDYVVCRNWIKSNGWTGAENHVAYPYGDYSPALITALKNAGFLTGRAAWSEDIPTNDLFQIPTLDICTVSVAELENQINNTINNGSTLVLMVHQLGAKTDMNNYVMSTTDFNNLLNYISINYVKTGKLGVTTISKWYDSVKNSY